MGRKQRTLILSELLRAERQVDDAELDRQLAACPAAAELADEDVEDFLAAAAYLDNWGAAAVAPGLRRAGVAVPVEITYDTYRLGRFLFRQWRDPQIRGVIFDSARSNYQLIARLRRRTGPRELMAFLDANGAITFAALRRSGMTDLLEELWRIMPAEIAAQCRTWLKVARLLLHRYLTEPEPPRHSSTWEQQKLARRIHLRDVQMRSLRRSQHRLRLERKELAARLRQAAVGTQPELAALAAELEELRRRWREAGQRHAAEMAELTDSYGAELERMKAELAALQRDQRELLALRAAWLPERKEG